MKIFQLKALEAEIRQGKLSEKDGLGYLIIFVILGAGLHGSSTFRETPFNTLFYCLNLLITIAGILQSYRLNKKYDNKDFLKRWMALSMVNVVRLVTALLIVFVPILVILNLFMNIQPCTLVCLEVIKSALYFLSVALVIRSFQRIRLE